MTNTKKEIKTEREEKRATDKRVKRKARLYNEKQKERIGLERKDRTKD